MIKRILKISLVLIFSGLIISYVINKNLTSKNQVTVYIPGEYFDNENLIPEFEKRYNTGIRFSNFDSNELAVSMINSGEKYDVAVLSDYAIQQLQKAQKIERIDWNLIKDKNGNKIDKEKIFSKELLKTIKMYNKQVGYNILDYAVPYFWGDVGILYNKKRVKKQDLEKYGWSIFQMTDKYKIAYYDSSRDGFMIALKDQGKSLNPLLNNEEESKNKENKQNIENAYQWLLKAKEKGKIDFLTDEIFDDLTNETYDLVFCYSGDASAIINPDDNNPPLDYLGFYVPKSGTNVFIDGAVIPKGADKEKAYKFLSFIIDSQMADTNEEAIRYISPLKEVFEKQIKRGLDIKEKYNNPEIYNIYNIDINDNVELFLYEKNMKELIDKKWTEFRAEN